MRLLPRLPALLLALLFPLTLAALPEPVRKGAVAVELVARDASIQPGHPFRVALRMTHDEHWHSYWLNPGTGYPTALTWTLPPGFSAGDIAWPVPHVVRDTAGKVTGYGYEGENYLFVAITPPADLKAGTDVTLAAKVEWLMCKDVCMPGEATVELTLPVRAQAPAADPAEAPRFDAFVRRLPAPPAGWTATAARGAQTITLHVRAPAGGHAPGEVHFFDADGLLDYTAPQTLREEAGGWALEMKLSDDAKPDAARLVGVLSAAQGWQADGSAPGVALEVPLTAAGAATPAVPGAPVKAPPAAAPAALTGTLLLALVGGLILNLMPCVFPVLGIKILGFVNQSGADHAKVVRHGVVFSLGVLVSFWVLAGALLVLRAGGAQLGWGFQLQSPAFVFGMAAFLLLFALNMSGVFEFGLAATGAGAGLQNREGFAGSFFTGALATLVATPCSAPFLAPALGAALTLSAAESLLVFTAIAVGLALPYLLLSIFPQAVRLLPRPGAWMETFKQFMAFPLYATVGWLLWVLAGQTSGDDNALLLILLGLVLVAMAAWLYGRFAQPHGAAGRRRAGRLAAAVVLAGGIAAGWPKAPAAPAEGTYAVVWEKWSPAAIAAAQQAGHPVYVDFTARWCATCQTNKATVFHNDAVLAEFARRKVVLLRGDWTNKDPLITAELARWGRSAVPFNLLYAPGKPDPVVLPELLTPDRVLAALAEADKR